MVLFRDIFSLFGRAFLATLFIWAGYHKIIGYEGTVAYMSSGGLPEFFAPFVILLELGGGLLLLVGFYARWMALALGLFSLAAAVMFHWDFAYNQQGISFMKNLAITGGMFFVAAFGPGRFSLDRG